ncbi:MAG: exodeoxyribonuclease VII large subunit [Betaproteobacteria bacterium]
MSLETIAGGASTEVLTVAGLNRVVGGLLARGLPLVKVRGEIGNLTRAASGHWYFTLKDNSAQVRCVMFRGRTALVGFAPREGDEVELRAQVGLYEARGEYQLTVEAMQRAGQGRLFEEFLRLKATLAAEGLFDEALKRPLPALPRAIGIVTSVQAAALRDVVTTLSRRAPYARLIVYPVPVQGAGAGARIAAMLDTANARAEADVLLLVRGGGSIEDLWAFNEEIVARAVRASALPIVVGVGHESDFTIADFAADLRAPTPTAAAELVAPQRAALLERLRDAQARLRRGAQRDVEQGQQRLDYALRVLTSPRAPLRGLDARLAQLRLRLAGATRHRLARGHAMLGARLPSLARRRPQLARVRARLESLAVRLQRQPRARLDRLLQRVQQQQQALVHLDPTAVLARGYAIVQTQQGRVVLDAGAVHPGDLLGLRLAHGRVQARAERIEPAVAPASGSPSVVQGKAPGSPASRD